MSLVPLRTWMSPTLVVDAGRFFPRDANPAFERLSGEPSSVAMLDHFGYDFASAHVGLELGRAWATFYLHGGVSYLRSHLSGTDTDGDVSTMTDVDVRVVGVSARLGFIIYLAK